MDSGDRSDNRLKAADSAFGSLRSQSFSNLFQGFFGVKQMPASAAGSVNDISSEGAESGESMPSEGRSLDTIVSPSNDDSWILSHLLHKKMFKEDENNLRRNVTWSELRKQETLRQPTSYSLASSSVDISKEHSSPQGLDGIHLEGESDDHIQEASRRGEEHTHASGMLSISKPMEHSLYSKNILSSFLSHDLQHSEMKRREDVCDLEQHGRLESRAGSCAAASVAQELPAALVNAGGDQVEQTLLPPATATSSGQLPDAKHSLKDLFWSFNHEKINVSRKEMNMIASIDQ